MIRLAVIVIGGDNLRQEAFAQQTINAQNQRIIYDHDMRVVTDSPIMPHIVGYTWNGGAYGLKKVLSEISFDNKGVFAMSDARGKTVNYIKKADDFSGVRLATNYHIQKIVEDEMDKAKIKGAVVVADVKTGGILAMVSKPDFDENNVVNYFNSKNGELINRAISKYNIGSIFKIVTASAALETSYSYEYTFNCKGKVNIDGRDFFCDKEEGHGDLTFNQGMAYSCNCLFYNLGMNLGYDVIKKYATDFGFGEQVLKINGFDESKGNLPDNVTTNQGLANVAIGQGEILATPVQVADMLLTVANDGVRKQLMLIDGIVDTKGQVEEILPTEIGRIISVDTARNIKQMLFDTVSYGTGMSASLKNYDVSGKTSTAETGWEQDGKVMTHGWFAGFFPSEEPKYVCVVLVENGGYGSESASPIFKNIAEKILDL